MDWTHEDTPHGGTHRHARPGVTLENCDAIQIWLECPPPASGAVIVWKNRMTSEVRPEKKGQRLRDLQPGDGIVIRGERRIVKSVEAYR